MDEQTTMAPDIDATDKVYVWDLKNPGNSPQLLYPIVAAEVVASNGGNWYSLTQPKRRGRPPVAKEPAPVKAVKQ